MGARPEARTFIFNDLRDYYERVTYYVPRDFQVFSELELIDPSKK